MYPTIYRSKKQVEVEAVEAVQFTDSNKDIVFNWITCTAIPTWDENGKPVIKMLTQIINIGDYVIKRYGKYYVMEQDKFNETYEIINEIGGK